jgi:hypothetical protein
LVTVRCTGEAAARAEAPNAQDATASKINPQESRARLLQHSRSLHAVVGTAPPSADQAAPAITLSVALRSGASSSKLGGGLVGAWLGFHAAPGLPAVLTTIAAAAAGANLTVILLDAARDRAAAEQAVAAAPRRVLASTRPEPEM